MAAPTRYGLLGRKLGHSWSPQIHDRLGSTPYDLVELEPNELASYVAGDGWQGLNVTIPYKVDVMDLADEVAPAARRLGAANTLTRLPDGRVRADNTDLYGFAWLLDRFCQRQLGASAREVLQDRKALVLGSGGASRAVVAALEDAGARACVISRKGPETYVHLAERHPDAVLVVNTTPVGMYPNCPESPLDDETLESLASASLRGVLDVIYNPERTGLCLAAEQLGLPAESGLAMLVAQARRSSELWRDAALPDRLMEDIERELRSQMRNVVLIGMPGSGKTSCGRALARDCGRDFVDLDAAFSERFGKSPAEVIETDGEDAFRTMETEVLGAFARCSGTVISCGGGVVTRPQNLPLLRQNGIIVMLDRPLDQLSSKGRPLSSTRGVEALAQERMHLYRSWADHILKCTGSATGDASALEDLLCLA